MRRSLHRVAFDHLAADDHRHPLPRRRLDDRRRPREEEDDDFVGPGMRSGRGDGAARGTEQPRRIARSTRPTRAHMRKTEERGGGATSFGRGRGADSGE